MYKVVKVRHFVLAPGEEMKVPYTVKGRVFSMARYLSYAATAINTTNQYKLENYYQALKGFPVIFFRAYGGITCDTNIARTNEFTVGGVQWSEPHGVEVLADVGHITHQVAVKCMRNVEFYTPFQTNTRATFVTSTSIQSGVGGGLDKDITQGHQAIVYPTLAENAGNIQ